ncbi:hypothetical protein ATCC90586_002355 [Pythium insidiosum]|nr:hypothetical protein ATCC90586_002355 [Pythium insidiosum]
MTAIEAFTNQDEDDRETTRPGQGTASAVQPASGARELAVEWRDISVVVRTRPRSSRQGGRVQPNESSKQILSSVSGEALPGELMVLMGPSGAGKSTLLDCIAGRHTSYTGSVLVNGKPWSSGLAKRSCYVLQDDLFYANLTVIEHLMFQAELRMPQGTTTTQRQERVDAVMAELGLAASRETTIGDAVLGKKGLSGGQRKRLSFATELLTNPSLLFVDEPTSGLDSFMAETVVLQMQALARRGRTVIATIHQPSSDLFAVFDRLFLLVDGRTVYHGPAAASIEYFASHGFPCPSYMNPTDHFMKVLAATSAASDSATPAKERIERLVAAWERAAKSSETETLRRRQTIASVQQSDDAQQRLAAHVDGRGALCFPCATRMDSDRQITVIRRVVVLCRRHWLRLIRDDVLFKARVGSIVFVNVLAGLVFRDLQRDQTGIQDFSGAMFFISVSQLFMYVNPELTAVPMEVPLVMREHNGGLYHVWLWYLAKNIVEFPLQLILPLLFLVPMYFLMGFDASADMFFEFFAFTALAASTATGLGYLVSCLSRRVDLAPVLGILFMLPFILFGGLFLNSASTPSYFAWLQSLSPVLYGFHSLMRVFWSRVPTIACRSGQYCVALEGDKVLRMYTVTTGLASQWEAVAYMLAINVSFRIAGAVVLWLRIDRVSRGPRTAGTASTAKPSLSTQ